MIHYFLLTIFALIPILGLAQISHTFYEDRVTECASCPRICETCPWIFTIGPEIFHFIRNRSGGTHQEGGVVGLRVTLERIKNYSLYLAIDYLYARGNLKGETATGRTLKSELTDQIFEARLGFTLKQPIKEKPFIIPFVGLGHFKEINDFQSPSPIPCKFTDTFNYTVVGFLSGINFTPLLSMGVNFKLRFMLKAQSKITEDPLFDEATLTMKEEMHVRVDIPFTYVPCNLRGVGFQLSPFYEYRHFGGREGFPFNFRDTKFYLYGARVALIYHF